MKVGDVFSRLTVISLTKGRKFHDGQALCRCECGNERSVRKSRLRVGAITQCADCAHREGSIKKTQHPDKMPAHISEAGTKYREYRGNARRKGIEFHIEREQFTTLIYSPCVYCGTKPALGVDRIDSGIGYEQGNVASCCSICNYAKRDLPVEIFLAWIKRVGEYQAILNEDF